MRNLYWGAAGVVGLALLIGCGGDAVTPVGTTATTGGTTGTSVTTGTATTGGTTTITYPSAGSYSGTYSSTVMTQGGPSTAGTSGSASLTIGSDGTFTLTLGDQNVKGTLVNTSTASESFSGTFTYDVTGGTATASVTGTATAASSQITVRFENFTDSSHANGTIYVAVVR